jgi:glycosyltransferase involved in cell wall biosynthesis
LPGNESVERHAHGNTWVARKPAALIVRSNPVFFDSLSRRAMSFATATKSGAAPLHQTKVTDSPDPAYRPTVAVVISVTECTPAALSRTLDTLVAQSLDHDQFHIVIVENGRHDAAIGEFLEALPSIENYRSATISVLRQKIKLEAAAAKRLGALRAKAIFTLFLHPGDQLDRQFLKKASLALDSCASAGWIYPARIEATPRNKFVPPRPFSPLALFIGHDTATGSFYRTDAWLKANARTPSALSNIAIYDEWDVQIRMIAAGLIGLPMRECLYYCEWSALDIARNTTKGHLLATYLTIRSNFARLPLLWRAHSTQRRVRRQGWGFVSRAHPMWLLDKLQERLSRKLGYGDAPATLGGRLLLLAAISPKRFIANFMDPLSAITLAELRCEFFRKPNLDFPIPAKLGPVTDSILFGQTNWTIGGAERVLQQWMRAARSATGGKIIDVCERETNRIPEVGTQYTSLVHEVRDQFAQLCDEQYSLEAMAETPLQRARICWDLICRERPRLIFISGNAFLYALLPTIREKLPDTVVVDVLHNEWYNHRDWFNLSAEYTRYIDERIVISDHWRDILMDKYGEHHDRIRVFHNAIDLDVFDPARHAREAARGRLGLRMDERIVAYVGRIQEQKNPAVFFELARHFEAIPGYRFIVVGDGPEREALMAKHGSLRNLTYLGPSNEVPRMIAAADLLVFTSVFEGYPLTSLEAAAMNVAVVAPDIIGFREQIETGKFGALYSPTGDPGHDASRIRDILLDRWDELIARGLDGRAFVEASHDSTKRQAEYAAYLSGLLADPSQARHALAAAGQRKRLYLHIGTHKTGSTSIQYFLDHNRDELKRRGLYYPIEHTYGYAHYPIAWFCTGKKSFVHPHIQATYTSRQQWEDDLLAFRDRLLDCRHDAILISSEGISVSDPARVARLFSDFDVKIIVFLRRQDGFLESIYNQNRKTKVDRSQTPEQHLDRMRSRLNYTALLASWASHFGPGNIQVVPFETRCFAHGLERKFLDLLGIKWHAEFLTEKKNTGLNRDCIEYLASSDLKDRLDKAGYQNVLDRLEEYSAEHPDPANRRHVYSPAVRKRLCEEHTPGNAQIARDYLGRDDGVLFENPLPDPDEPWEPYPGLLTEAKRDIESFLIGKGVAANCLAPSVRRFPGIGNRHKSLYLHIGHHKTGSSSIQHFLSVNRDALLETGVRYPDMGPAWAHHELASVCLNNKSSPQAFPVRSQERFGSREEWAEHVGRLRDDWLMCPEERIILSSEQFKNNNPFELRGFLDGFDVKVIVFLRRQDEKLESGFNQRLKSGNISQADYEGFLKAGAKNYFTDLLLWEEAFGEGNILVQPFEKQSLEGGLERKFLSLAGIGWDDGLHVPQPVNSRLSRDCTAFLIKHGLFPSRLNGGKFQRLLRLLEQYTDEHPNQPEYKHAYSPSARLEVLERCRESNTLVARHFLGRDDGILFTAPEPSPDDPWRAYPGLDDKTEQEITDYILHSGLDLPALQTMLARVEVEEDAMS